MTISPFLIFHIAAGAIVLLSGAAAMIFRKGSGRHRTSGNVFFVFMLLTSASATCLALLHPMRLAVLNGILAFYLVVTAWLTVRRNPGATGLLEKGGLLAALALAAGFFLSGMEAAHSETGLKDGFTALPYCIFGTVALLCAALDLRLILQGGVAGAQRLARHLWRMCFAMWMATTTFFLGQEKIFPEWVRETGIFYAPVILVIVFTAYWLIRVLFADNRRSYGKERPV
ncbi:MAG TPA: hypothetical protein VFX02_08880 [Gammaproteobacteria bacterium]|nr:hypothetical protein [Gammaproteobacteria bacterium]